MKLDATDLRYMAPEEFRVLTAVRARLVLVHRIITQMVTPLSFPQPVASIQVEMGSKNHEVVPSVLIAQVSGIRNGGVNKILGKLAQRNLVAKVQNSKCGFPRQRVSASATHTLVR
jgi:RIO kinase 2